MADLYQVDERGQLFISPAIDAWEPLADTGIDVVIDLEGGLDACIPCHVNRCLYIYFPIADDNEDEPPLPRLQAIARLGASLIGEGHRVLSHCGMGFNRSALVAGLILVELGVPGPLAVEQLRRCRPGALYNDKFAEVLAATLPLRGYSI
jgi:hypothetical protein